MNRRIVFLLVSIGLAMASLASWFVWIADVRAVHAAPPPLRPAAAERTPIQRLMQQTTVTPTYVVSDSLTGGIVYDWVEIAATGDRVPLVGDNWGSREVDIGFYFPFYDRVYRTFRVSTNGYIYFGQNAAYGGHTPIFIGSASDPNGFIAPFGSDLFVHPDVSRVYVRREAERTVIEFVDIQWCCGLNDPHTFEIILYRDGRILTQYRQVRFLSNPNSRVVAGIENADGSDGLAYYQDYFEENTGLGNSLAVLYDPGDTIFGHLILDTPQQYLWDDPGYGFTTTATLFNLSGITDVFSLTYRVQVSSSVVPTAALWPVDMPETAAITVTGPSTNPVTLPYPIANLEEATFDISVTIPVTAGHWDLAQLVITASAASSPTISTTIAITYGVAHRDLSIAKILAPDQPRPAPGGYFRYRLLVTNGVISGSNRYGWARDVRVTDMLPQEADLVDLDADTGDSGTLLLPGFYWNIGDMAPGDTEALDAYMWLPATVPTDTVLTNTAWTTMEASIELGPLDNNTVVHTTTLDAPEITLDIEKLLVSPLGAGLVGVGRVATYTIGVANRGNVLITGTIVTDVLPVGTTFYTTTWPTFTQMGDGRTLVFDIGNLTNGGWNAHIFEVAIQIPLTMPVGTALTNTVYVTTTASLERFVHAEGDMDTEVAYVIDPRGDVAVVKMAESVGGTPTTPEAGSDYTFWISYTNRGYVTVYTVTLTDTLPLSYVVLLEAGPAGVAQPDTSIPGQVVWQLEDLVPGEIGWTRVRIGIDGNTPNGTQLVNTAHIADAEGLNITTTNDVSVVTVTLDAADVTIGKTVWPSGLLTVGQRITYTVRFTNTGALAATGVRITDMLPSELTGVTWMTVTGGHPIEPLDEMPPQLLWRTTEPMDPGDWGQIIISAQLDPHANWTARPILVNQATIRTTTQEEPDDDPNTAQVANPVALASPYVVKTGPTLAKAGGHLTYTIEYGNDGLLPAEGVRLTDTLPVSTTFVSQSAADITVTTGNGWVAWDVGTISETTTSLTFTLVVSVSPHVVAGTLLENRIVLTSTTYDGNREDNESIWPTSVGIDLSSSRKLVNGTTGEWVDAGLPATYTIILENAGPSDALGVALEDPIPAHTAYISGTLNATSGLAGYDASGVITWSGTVSGLAQVTITFQVTVTPAGPLPRGTVITNTAFISDRVRGFQVSVPMTVTGPNLGGSYKTVNERQPNSGDRITYTIVLENSGEADAVGASLEDTLPSAYVVYGGEGWASSGQLGSTNPVTWTGTVTTGQRVTITLPVTVTAGPGNHFVNTARIYDGTGAEVQRSVTVSTTRPIIQVQKQVWPAALASGERATYTIVITNSGNGWAYSARLTDTIQGGAFAPGDATASGGALDDSTPPTITWSGAVEPYGGVVLITVPVTITASPGSDVSNVAYVNDGYGNVVQSATSLHVYSAPDLSGSTKIVDRTDARTGETLVYTLTVVNGGELPTSFLVTDTLDANTVFSKFIGSPPGSYGYASGVVTWSGTLGGLSQAELAFAADVNASTSSRITNTARIGGDGTIYTRTAGTDVIAPAGLTATKTADPVGSVVAGGYLTYSVVIQNIGGDTGHATFSDHVPDGTVYVAGSAQVIGSSVPVLYDESTTLTWEDDLTAGKTVTIQFQLQVIPGTLTGTLIENIARLQETNEPGVPFSVTVTNTVVSPVFTATKRATPADAVLPGHRITYTLSITNLDGGVARVAVTDTLPVSTTCDPSSLEVQPQTLPRPTCSGGDLYWLGNLDTDSTVRLVYAVALVADAPDGYVLHNGALLQELSAPDGKVTVSTTHTVVVPTLDAVKRVEPAGSIVAGAGTGTLTYTIVLSNSGSAPAQATLDDPLPAATEYVTAYVTPSGYAPPTYTPLPPTVHWDDTLAPGERVTITLIGALQSDIPNGTVVSNTVTVQETSLPGEPFTREVSNTVLAPALRVSKWAAQVGDVLAGSYLDYGIGVANDGDVTATVYLSDTLPAHTSLVTSSVTILPAASPPPTYTSDTLIWQGTVAPGQAVTLSFQVQVVPGTISGTAIANVAWVQDVQRPGVVVTASVTHTVIAPPLVSNKQAIPMEEVRPGDVITYHITLYNPSEGIVRASVSDPLPTYTHYISGSAGIVAGGLPLDPPIYQVHDSRLMWEGDVPSLRAITLTFGVTVSLSAPQGASITNTAWIDTLSDPAAAVARSVVHTVATQFDIYLPVVLRNH